MANNAEAIEVEHPDHSELAGQLARVLVNLRFATKYWKENGGYHARKVKNDWEDRADILLDSLGIDAHRHTSSVRILKP